MNKLAKGRIRAAAKALKDVAKGKQFREGRSLLRGVKRVPSRIAKPAKREAYKRMAIGGAKTVGLYGGAAAGTAAAGSKALKSMKEKKASDVLEGLVEERAYQILAEAGFTAE